MNPGMLLGNCKKKREKFSLAWKSPKIAIWWHVWMNKRSIFISVLDSCLFSNFFGNKLGKQWKNLFLDWISRFRDFRPLLKKMPIYFCQLLKKIIIIMASSKRPVFEPFLFLDIQISFAHLYYLKILLFTLGS